MTVKKASIIILCIFYFIVAAGLNISLHYCAGKFKGISLLQEKEDGCCGSKKKSKGCCKEKTVSYKIKDNHQSASKVLVSNTSIKQLLVAYVILDFKVQSPLLDLHAVPDFHAPPDAAIPPVYLLNNNFRI